MKRLISLTVLVFLCTTSYFSQNVGIGTTSPTNTLHVLVDPTNPNQNPVRFEGLLFYTSETSVLAVDPSTGIVKHMPINAVLASVDSAYLDSTILTTVLNNMDTIFGLMRDSLLLDSTFMNTLRDSIDTDIDSMIFANDTLYLYEDNQVLSTYINASLDTALVDSLILAKSDTLYSIISDSLNKDTLWIKQLDSLLNIYGDTIYFNDSSYTLVRDSLLNDSIFLDSLISLIKDSIDTDIDSMIFANDTLYLYEDNQVLATYIPILDSAHLDSVYTFISDSLLNDSLWIDSLGKLLYDNDWDINANGTGLEASPAGNNVASGLHSISAGFQDTVTTNYGGILSGRENLVNAGSYSVVPGGYQNKITNSTYSSSSGYRNVIDNSNSSFVHGDNDSIINAPSSAVLGKNNVLKADLGVAYFLGNSIFGEDNKIEAFAGDWVNANMIGGKNNRISGYAYYTTILGGNINTIDATTGDVGRAGIFAGGGNHISHIGTNPVNTQSAVIIGGNNDSLIGTQHSGIFSGIQNKVTKTLRAGIFVGINNTIDSASQASIIGGVDNLIYNNATSSSILGGSYDTISGAYSAITGGYENKITSTYSNISGGYQNKATGTYTSVNGGYQNLAQGSYSVVGGYRDTVLGSYGAVLSGRENSIISGSYITIPGGYQNKVINSTYANVSGYQNYADNSFSSLLIHGYRDTAIRSVEGTFIAGRDNAAIAISPAMTGRNTIFGTQNKITVISGNNSHTHTIAGGLYNEITGASGTGNSISIFGGNYNTIDASAFSASSAGIFAGTSHVIGGPWASGNSRSIIIGGSTDTLYGGHDVAMVAGLWNKITSSHRAGIFVGRNNELTSSPRATIIGGFNNTINSGANGASIIGGDTNTIDNSADHAIILGGTKNTANNYSQVVLGHYSSSAVPAGSSSSAVDPDNILFKIGNGTDPGNLNDALVVKANGNAGVNTSTPTNQLHIAGGTDPIRAEGLQYGGTTDSVLVTDGTGVIKLASINAITRVCGNYVFTNLNGETVISHGLFCIANVRTFTLPAANTVTGRKFVVKLETIPGTSATISAVSGNIDGAASYEMVAAGVSSVILQSDGANYWIIGSH